MYKIDLYFDSLEELPTAYLFGAIGLYVLWAPGATDRPTYVGEGQLMKRLCSHVEWLKRGVTGVVARLNVDGIPSARAKRDGQIAEAFLLRLAQELEYTPTQNRSAGHVMKVLNLLISQHGVIRLNVRGFHPFRRPDVPGARLKETAQLSVRLQSDLSPFFMSPWNRRRGSRVSR